MHGIIGIKLHPRLSGFSLENEEFMKKLVSVARDTGLILYICTILRTPAANMVNPPHIDCKLLELNSINGTDIVLLHGGYTDLLPTSEVVKITKMFG